ncbi:unnamed protein product, partial [Medioppia subpectinata]
MSMYHELTKELFVNFYFRQTWTDPRLQYNDQMTNGVKVVGGLAIIKRIWTPDTFFPNSHLVELFRFPAPNIFM